MGYNGMANCGECMETDDLFKVKKLMDTDPVVPISQEEFNEWCKPGNYSVLTHFQCVGEEI